MDQVCCRSLLYLGDNEADIQLIRFVLQSAQGRKLDTAFRRGVYCRFIRKNEVIGQTFLPEAESEKDTGEHREPQHP